MERITLHRNDALHKDHPVEFSLQQAKNLLTLQVKMGVSHYSLPKNSKLEFKDGDFTRKSGSRNTKGA